MYETGFIDIKPISVNECFSGRRFRTPYFKQWQMAVHGKLPNQFIDSKKLAVNVFLFFKYPTRQDADNYVKAILDCLKKRGIIRDDRYIYNLNISKVKSDHEGFNVEIINLEEGVPT